MGTWDDEWLRWSAIDAIHERLLRSLSTLETLAEEADEGDFGAFLDVIGDTKRLIEKVGALPGSTYPEPF